MNFARCAAAVCACALTGLWRGGGVHMVAAQAGRPAPETIRYVATDGNDTWSGTLSKPNRERTDGPFATVSHARDALRAVRGGPAHVMEMQAGAYALDQAVTFGPDDHGLTVRAHGHDEVRLQGGHAIAGWQPVSDTTIRARLDPAALPHIMQTDLRTQGVADFGRLTARGFGRPDTPAPLELFYEDAPMTLARWPNVGHGASAWAQIAATPKGPDGDVFTYTGDRPTRWKADEDIWLHGYFTFDWADTYQHVAAIDTTTRAFTLGGPKAPFGYAPGKRWYALNVLEELDAPGEYYVDRKSGMLYFYAPAPMQRESRAVVSTTESALIEVDGASDLKIEGLTIEDGRGLGIVVRDTHGASITGCTIRNLGNSGVEIRGGDHCRIVDCELYNVGDRGVELSGGDRASLTPCDHEAVNCTIHDYSRWDKTYRAGVGVDGVGIRVANCHIYNAPHNAILLSGNDNLIERNEIDHVCQETGDAGAFYMGRDWTMRGNIVLDNWFHDLAGVQGQHGFTDVMAVYLDDCASGTLVQRNIFQRVHGRAIMVGGGRDDRVVGNLFVDCTIAVHVDARAQGWAKKYADPGGDWKMQDKMASIHYDQPPYSAHYPQLAAMKTDDDSFPRGTEVVDNVIAEGAPLDSRWLVLQDGLTDQKLPIRDNTLLPLSAAETPKDRPATLRADALPPGNKFTMPAVDCMGVRR